MSKTLIIVESPTKAKTISKFLGNDYIVQSSFGHIRDLPKKNMGVDIAHDFFPTYEIPEKSKTHVNELKRAAKDAQTILLASDEDREGEAIAWHVAQLLKLDATKQNRITFHEITKNAIQSALASPRALDMNLVNAQQARRILDRLVGYELSPFLWQKVQRGLSAGRVQSVAVRLIVERERERRAFLQEEYWTIDALFEKDAMTFEGKLVRAQGKKIEKHSIQNGEEAQKIVDDLTHAEAQVEHIATKEVSKTPPLPFTTSTLQIEANNKLGFSAKQTMALAQKLYETGRITYMRTDSVNLAEKFLQETQQYLSFTFGDLYAQGAKRYKTTSKGAQEAHEAIRPTDIRIVREQLPKNMTEQTYKLYDLIWRRTLACQMPSAKLSQTSVDIQAKDYLFRSTGNSIVFDGFMKVYRSAKEKLLPPLRAQDKVKTISTLPHQHFTEPPARYSDATLVKTLEEYGIGRPSTYAPTIGTIIDRGYIERDEQKKLFPQDIAMIVNDVLVQHFPNIVDYQFTAKLETDLDDIAEGKKEWVPALKEFYGPFHDALKEKQETLKREDIMREREVGRDPKSGINILVKNGRFGPFVQLGEWTAEDKKDKKPKPRSASLLKGQSLDTITLEEALYLLILPRLIGQTEENIDIVADEGRFGPYLRAGDLTAPIPKEEDPRTISLEKSRELLQANKERKELLATPIAEFGTDPESGKLIQVRNGRYGPYVTDGTTHMSIPKRLDPKTLTFEQAIELLAQKRAHPQKRWQPKQKKTSVK